MIHVAYYTPAANIIFQCFLTIAYVLIGDFNLLINAFSFFTWTCQCLSAISVLVLRKKFPHLPRPYRV